LKNSATTPYGFSSAEPSLQKPQLDFSNISNHIIYQFPKKVNRINATKARKLSPAFVLFPQKSMFFFTKEYIIMKTIKTGKAKCFSTGYNYE